jgi:hypothetical protein
VLIRQTSSLVVVRWETLEIKNCGGSIAKERAEFNCEPRLIPKVKGLEIEIEIGIEIGIEQIQPIKGEG